MPPRPARSRLLLLALGTVLLGCAVGCYFALRPWIHPRPPRVVRLLPEGETVVYVDAAALRRGGWMGAAGPALLPAADYAAFVGQSGFDFERDLDAVGVSLAGAPADPSQTTAVLEGRFGPRFLAYLAAHALRQHRYGARTAYIFPGWAHPERPLAVVPWDADTVIVSNAAAVEAVFDHASRWWPAAPSAWRARSLWSPPPIACIAMDTGRLADQAQLGAWDAPLRGSRYLAATLDPDSSAGLRLAARDETRSGADADRIQDWASQQIAELRRQLPEDGGGSGPTLRALLDGIQLQAIDGRVGFDLRLSAATLRQWHQAAAPR